MRDFIGIAIFILFFLVLPALDKRQRAKRRGQLPGGEPPGGEIPGVRQQRPRQSTRPIPTAETTFEHGPREAAADTAELAYQAERARRVAEAEMPQEQPAPASIASGLGGLWAEVERLSTGDVETDLEVEGAVEGADVPTPVLEDLTPREMPQVMPAYTSGADSIITARRAPPPELEAPPKLKHSGRLTHGHSSRTTLMGREIDAAELRRAILYREILGPPVSMRRGGSHLTSGDFPEDGM